MLNLIKNLFLSGYQNIVSIVKYFENLGSGLRVLKNLYIFIYHSSKWLVSHDSNIQYKYIKVCEPNVILVQQTTVNYKGSKKTERNRVKFCLHLNENVNHEGV